MQPIISVIIPAYNVEYFINEALSSVLNQSWTNLDVLVVDDGSADGTRERCAELIRNGKIRCLETENRGPNSARNLGISQARGDYIALLDADDVWAPEKLKKQMAVFATYPDTGMIFCDFSTFNEIGTVADGKTASLFNELEPQTFDKLFARNNFILPSTVLICRQVFDRCGHFDERLRGAEDYEMWLRISRNFQIRGISESLVQIREHPGNSSKYVGRMYENELVVVGMQQHMVTPLLYRRRLAKVNFLAADRMVCGGDRSGSLRYLFRGLTLEPFLVIDLTVIIVRTVLGQQAVEKIRRWLNRARVPRILFEQLFKRF